MNLALKKSSTRAAAGLLSGALVLAFLGTAQAAEAPASFADLAAKVTPAVVNISSTHKAAQAGDDDGRICRSTFPKGSPFEEFFKHFREQPAAGNGAERVMALGSGFIIDPAGYVVTNNHVIDEATDIEVTLTDGRSIPAKLIGTDDKTDLALLKIDARQPLPDVAFGDSDAGARRRLGDRGRQSVRPRRHGDGRHHLGARPRHPLRARSTTSCRSTRPINRGNSGGPTFNLDGEVIGINTAIYSPNGGSVGIGFAIPSNLAKPVIDAAARARPRRARLARRAASRR